jgi:hypothetical protein
MAPAVIFVLVAQVFSLLLNSIWVDQHSSQAITFPHIPWTVP